MKKIIYSLVIMIAAGSLFTSCIAQTELDSSYDKMRYDKAEYIRNMRILKDAAMGAEKDYMDALAQKAQAEAKLLEAQKDLLEQLTPSQVAEAEAKAALAAIEAEIANEKLKQIKDEIEEKASFLSPAMQKAYIAAALAYFGAQEAVIVLNAKWDAETNPVEKDVLKKALSAATSACEKAKKHWDKVSGMVEDAIINGGKVFIDPTEAIEDLLGALPDDMKSAIMDKILEALASIVD